MILAEYCQQSVKNLCGMNYKRTKISTNLYEGEDYFGHHQR